MVLCPVSTLLSPVVTVVFEKEAAVFTYRESPLGKGTRSPEAAPTETQASLGPRPAALGPQRPAAGVFASSAGWPGAAVLTLGLCGAGDLKAAACRPEAAETLAWPCAFALS